jgi:phosphate transport system substrate-binding protein
MRLTVFLSALLLATAPLRAAEADGLTVVGSDLLGKKFSAGLTAFAQRAGLALKLNLTGSHAGLDALQDNKADLALLVFSKREKPPGAPFVARPVAYHTVVAVVPADLPLEQLSFAQLRAIYCASEGDQPPKSWDALGVPATSTWGRASISPVISGPGGGLAYDLFRNNVLPSPGLRVVVTVEADASAALKRVAVGSSGLAIVPVLPPGRKDLKALSLSRGTRDVAFGPTPENIHSGDYPVPSLPLHLVFRADAAKRLLPLLRFLHSTDAVTLWQDAQLVPLPASAREGQIAEFETM